MRQPWIGCDLDGTLAEHAAGGSIAEVGPPILEMLARVKGWLAAGIEVRIVTARVGESLSIAERAGQRAMIYQWCREHLGQILQVTAAKDLGMVELWDDRAVQVIRNTGIRADEASRDTTVGAIATWLSKQDWQGCDPKDLAAAVLGGAWRL